MLLSSQDGTGEPGCAYPALLHGWVRRESVTDARAIPPAGGGGRAERKTGVVPIEDKRERVDWNAIRAEYIGGGISYRGIAKKYGIPLNTIQDRGKADGWVDARKRAADEITATTIQKAAEKAADNATIAADIKRQGLLLLQQLFADFAATATEHREYDGKDLTRIKRLRDLTGAYKDLTDDILPGAAADNALLQSLLDMERRAGS